MLSRTMETVFRPGMTTSIHAQQNRCTDSHHRSVPS